MKSFSKGNRIYQKFFQSKNIRMFKSRKECFDYMEKEVFLRQEFQIHITETAKESKVSYLLAYEIITNFLTDTLYEIDLAVTDRERKKRISVHSYFYLQVGFMVSTENKKMFLQKLIKL